MSISFSICLSGRRTAHPYTVRLLRRTETKCHRDIGTDYTPLITPPTTVLQAESYYRRALAIQPENGELWALLGHCYLKQDYVRNAYDAYLKALQFTPRQDVNVRSNRSSNSHNALYRQAQSSCMDWAWSTRSTGPWIWPKIHSCPRFVCKQVG